MTKCSGCPIVITMIKNNYKSFNIDTPPNSLIDLTVSPKVKTAKGQGVGVLSLVRNTLGVKGHARDLGWGLKRVTSGSIIHMDYINQTTSWLVCSWSTFGAQNEPWVNMDSQDLPRPGLEGSHHLPFYSILCA